jgi:FlaA1/EpsC-like NDP-sugar epimerase
MSKSLLITGGTGTFGTNFLKYEKLRNYYNRIIIFSRDESKQFELKKKFSIDKKFFKKLRFFLGDVRDKDRLTRAVKNIDDVIHAAALKHVASTEYNPDESLKTNVFGTMNLIDSCIAEKVKKILLISTDKAVSPVNLYGATKLCAEKLFMSANAISGKDSKFSILRYGNVYSSRGSLFEILNSKDNINITDPNMTRFHISKKNAIENSFFVLKNMKGNEIFIPKLRSYKLSYITEIFKKKKFKIIGAQRGEKIHESLISGDENLNIFENKKFYILSSSKNYLTYKKSRINLPYTSSSKKDLMNIAEFKQVLKTVNEI